MKLTLKQERFCQAYMETGNASEAYRRAYNTETMQDSTVNERACRMVKECKISARLDELKAEVAKKNEITLAEIVEDLRKACALAESAEKGMDLGNLAMHKAKLAGLLVEKSEHTVKQDHFADAREEGKKALREAWNRFQSERKDQNAAVQTQDNDQGEASPKLTH